MSPDSNVSGGPLKGGGSRSPRRRPDPRRFPAWLAVPLATFGGYVAASWMGAAFGLLAGFFLWRARR